MDQGERRIRSLKLRGPDDSQLLQLRYGLEEAFRIASLPNLPANATVLIRHLDLGAVRSGLAAVQLADRIAEAVRALATEAICIDQEPGDDARAVWFSDPLQPYRLLLQRLLDGKAVDAWYWRSFFSEQTPGLNEGVITDLFIAACRTSVKGLAVPLLIQSCIETPRLSRLLSLVTPALARRVLREQGMLPVRALAPPTGGKTQQPQSRGALQSEIRPLRRIDAPDISLAWRRAMQKAVAYWGCDDMRSHWLALQALVCRRPAYLARPDTWHDIELTHWLETWSVMRPRHGSAGINRPGPLRHSRSTTSDKHHNVDPDFDSFGWFKRPAQSPLGEDLGDVRASVNACERKPSGRDPGHDPGLEDRTALFSRHAGFALLIPLLQRLGMDRLLQHHDALLAADFPRQLLWTMATRFVPDEDDPCRCLFNDTEATPDARINRFNAPPLWWRLAEESGRSPRCLTLQASDLRVAELINAFQLASGLFLRRHCALSLRGLIHRPGRVELTPTHWDVTFEINQTDLRLRRMALDIDPGWVPWLGYVVRFHYRSGGAAHVQAE